MLADIDLPQKFVIASYSAHIHQRGRPINKQQRARLNIPHVRRPTAFLLA